MPPTSSSHIWNAMSAPLPISVLLLARDEAERLERLLPTLAFAREVVVVVDEASRDGTRAVAERHGARVYVRRLDGFGAQRQFALAQCREEWVLWIDADETLDARARQSMAEAVGWTTRFLQVLGSGECELRPVYEPADFARQGPGCPGGPT